MTDRRLALLLFAAAFLVRLVAWMGTAIFGTDGCHYLFMADGFRDGRFAQALDLSYHPMYPLLTAIAGLLSGNTPAAGALVSVTLGAAAVFPLFALVRAVFGRPEAFIAGLLYGFNPTIVDVQSDVLTEGTFTFFFLGSMGLAWRQLEEPTLARATALAAASAAAYLTRPEGILAVVFCIGWPLAASVVRRDRRAALALGALVSFVVVAVAVYPYLAWIRSVKGHWDLSARPSVASAARSVGALLSEVEPSGGGKTVQFLKSIYRLTYLVTIPFYLIGLVGLFRRVSMPVLFFLSYPVGHLGGVLFALRAHNFMTYRYVIPAMAVLTGVAALGMTIAIRWAGARLSPARLSVAAGALLLAVAVLPCARAFAPTRWECRSYYDAAAWIRARGRPRAMSGPIQQVSYLAGCRSFYSLMTPEGIAWQVREEQVDYYVYTEKDVEKRPDYVSVLRSSPVLDPPVEIVGPPGTWKVFIQKAR